MNKKKWEIELTYSEKCQHFLLYFYIVSTPEKAILIAFHTYSLYSWSLEYEYDIRWFFNAFISYKLHM